MKSKAAGVWIDRKKAVVVTIVDEEEHVEVVPSGVESQLRREEPGRFPGGFEAHRVPEQDHQQRAVREHLNVYYDSVIDRIGDADPVLVMGPGEAKAELKRRAERRRLSDRIAAVETVDKMTDRQIVAKVREWLVR